MARSARTILSQLAGSAVLLLAWGISGSSALAESNILLPFPDTFGVIPASTYDLHGERVGSSQLSLIMTSESRVLMSIMSGVVGGARTEASAELATVVSKTGGRQLRLLSERSQSYDESGRSLGLLQLNHETGEATCSPADGVDAGVVEFDLPENDRITNVPLNLLFLPLVQGEVEEIDFQLFLCRGGPRILEFAATIAGGTRPAEGEDFRVVEIQYRPELGPMLSWLARGFTPNLSFWFDANGGGTYLAHRMPLYSRGPEVMIVRDGISPSLFEAVP